MDNDNLTKYSVSEKDFGVCKGWVDERNTCRLVGAKNFSPLIEELSHITIFTEPRNFI